MFLSGADIYYSWCCNCMNCRGTVVLIAQHMYICSVSRQVLIYWMHTSQLYHDYIWTKYGFLLERKVGERDSCYYNGEIVIKK